LKPKLHQIEVEAEGKGHKCREATRIPSLPEAKPKAWSYVREKNQIKNSLSPYFSKSVFPILSKNYFEKCFSSSQTPVLTY